jgi:hypothetical protein
VVKVGKGVDEYGDVPNMQRMSGWTRAKHVHLEE